MRLMPQVTNGYAPDRIKVKERQKITSGRVLDVHPMKVSRYREGHAS